MGPPAAGLAITRGGKAPVRVIVRAPLGLCRLTTNVPKWNNLKYFWPSYLPLLHGHCGLQAAPRSNHTPSGPPGL